jgi:hypothetical protein
MNISEFASRGLSNLVSVRRETPADGVKRYMGAQAAYNEAVDHLQALHPIDPYDSDLVKVREGFHGRMIKAEGVMRRGLIMETSLVLAGVRLVLKRKPISEGHSADRVPQSEPNLQEVSARSFHHKE